MNSSRGSIVRCGAVIREFGDCLCCVPHGVLRAVWNRVGDKVKNIRKCCRKKNLRSLDASWVSLAMNQFSAKVRNSLLELKVGDKVKNTSKCCRKKKSWSLDASWVSLAMNQSNAKVRNSLLELKVPLYSKLTFFGASKPTAVG
ncbi:hypothetical protein Drorol1_Dr00004159 [Drosera rotundifolia]